ncbi:hypothetical protein ANCDUO_13023 [Ancylostoma duodenale]|uniref:Reverse transcriptase/retrotransposon-derived protein RNase H-like domain-containing protein n=1 Tax=Ancylostoma duodenale TaxID=51022 RepID=A0A0C2D425_9BILA|nr:hypothetical protein ANCDUO_13023 [Ancylostoma duodenale]
MPDYQQFKDQYQCRMATTALGKIRNETVTSLKALFADLFSPRVGRCTKTKAKLVLKPDATPMYRQGRPVLFASQSAVDAEIDRLLNEGVLSAIHHSNWAPATVVVKKSSGATWIRADFSTGLNDALMLHQHPLPTAEEVFTNLNGGQLFSKSISPTPIYRWKWMKTQRNSSQ